MSQVVTVGITGYARSGKDTVAQCLVEQYGFTKRSFADSLREHVYDLDPIVGTSGYWTGGQINDVYRERFVRYQEAIDTHGYEDAKATYPEIRRLLQRYGTEVWRERDPYVWVNLHRAWVAARPEVRLVVVPDVRFPNEASYVDRLIRVERPGVGPVNGHASDNQVELLHPDAVLVNDGDIQHLWDSVARIWPTLSIH